ncbi:hypothetical protein BOTNAR_0172g00060 [Botryotinia narcissicola]|uniref:Uncharacterized protein n=1 Tax=Botryotinia narcissicola TaxID=278944 RepID=A0A4Z1IBC1_9HELO|nr:hypothetical protein BOTNAR_0172g00060 [Botryotinia narcissicola]
MDEKTPATILSHGARRPAFIVPSSRKRVAIKADEIVDAECCCCPRIAVNSRENGMIPILAMTYIESSAPPPAIPPELANDNLPRVESNPCFFPSPLNPGVLGATALDTPAVMHTGLANLVRNAESHKNPWVINNSINVVVKGQGNL